jgi:hypothetical protein
MALACRRWPAGAAPPSLGRDFQVLVAQVHKQLTPSVYSFLTDMQVGWADGLGWLLGWWLVLRWAVALLQPQLPAAQQCANHARLPPRLLGCRPQEVTAEGRKGSAARIRKELQNIPRLVFLVEEWEKQLVALGKASGWPAPTAAWLAVAGTVQLQLPGHKAPRSKPPVCLHCCC